MFYYKAIRPNGMDFYTGKFRWAPEGSLPSEPYLVTHPSGLTWPGETAYSYLSVSTEAADCTGMLWPCRLLKVRSPDGRMAVQRGNHYPNKRVDTVFEVVEELEPHLAFGPNGRQVVAFMEKAHRLPVRSFYYTQDSKTEASRLCRALGRQAARNALSIRYQFNDSAKQVSIALLLRDALKSEHWYALTRIANNIIDLDAL